MTVGSCIANVNTQAATDSLDTCTEAHVTNNIAELMEELIAE